MLILVFDEVSLLADNCSKNKNNEKFDLLKKNVLSVTKHAIVPHC